MTKNKWVAVACLSFLLAVLVGIGIRHGSFGHGKPTKQEGLIGQQITDVDYGIAIAIRFGISNRYVEVKNPDGIGNLPYDSVCAYLGNIFTVIGELDDQLVLVQKPRPRMLFSGVCPAGTVSLAPREMISEMVKLKKEAAEEESVQQIKIMRQKEKIRDILRQATSDPGNR